MIKKAANIVKGSGVPNREKVGQIKREQIEEIAKVKMPDLNTRNLASAAKTVEAVARSMGVEIVD